MKRKPTTYFITLKNASAVSPVPINQDSWDKLIATLRDLLHPHNTPLEIGGQKNNGSILLDSNAVSFSPVNPEFGGDFTLKRVGSKILTRVKSTSPEYDVIVGACLLAIKKHISEAVVSHNKSSSKWDESIRYFEYVTEAPSPVVYPAQAKSVTVSFEWNPSMPAEDCEAVLEDIRAILGGNARDVVIKFDKPA